MKTKLMESEILVQQARNNTKEQFANSPDLQQELLNAIMDAFHDEPAGAGFRACPERPEGDPARARQPV